MTAASCAESGTRTADCMAPAAGQRTKAPCSMAKIGRCAATPMSAPWSSAGTTRAWASFEVSVAGRSRCACSTTSTRSPRCRAMRAAGCGSRRSATASETAAVLLDAGRRLGLDGWVLYPTRDETVAAISRHRAALTEMFRVPTPEWSTVRWASDKRETYQLAARLDIPTPRTWYVDELAQLDAIEGDGPFVIKPAIKGDFFQTTKAKAWKAGDRAELVRRFEEGARLVGAGRADGAGADPGRRSPAIRVLRLLQGRRSGRQHDGSAAAPAPARVRAREHLRREHRPPRPDGAFGAVPARDRLLRADRARVQARSAATGGTSCSTSTRAPGATTAWAPTRAWTSRYLLFQDQLGQPGRRLPRTGWAALDPAPHRPPDWRSSRSEAVTCSGATYLRTLRFDTEAVFSWKDPLPGLAEVALIPYLYFKRGF